MRLACLMLGLCFVAVSPALATEIPVCKTAAGGVVVTPSHKGCKCVTCGPSFRGGYIVDCKGRKLCQLPDTFKERVIIGKKVTVPPDSATPFKIGAMCITFATDALKTYIRNKCSVDLNIKWNDDLCAVRKQETYPCSVSLKANGRTERKLIVKDTQTTKGKSTVTVSHERTIDFGRINSVACKSPLYPYEKANKRVVCQ